MENESLTKYETARILGARALQLSMNAPMLLAIPKDKLEEVNFDPLKIAELEFNAGILPITIKRPLPERLDEEGPEEEEDSELVQEISVEEDAQKAGDHSKPLKSVEKESAELEDSREAETKE